MAEREFCIGAVATDSGRNMLTKCTTTLRTILVGTGLLVSAPGFTQTPLTFGASGGISTATQPLFYAQAAGLFKKRGLDVSIMRMADDTTAVLSFVSGSFDMLYTSAAAAMVAQARNAEFKLVASIGPRSDYQLVTQKSIASLKEMEGKSMAVSKIGAVSYVAPVFVLKKAGVDVSKVRFLALGNDAARGQALVNATVDSAPLIGVQSVLALKNGPNLHRLVDVGAQFQDFLYTGIYATSAAIKQKHDAVAAAVEALIEASRKQQSDKAAAVAQAVAMGLPEDAIQTNYDVLLASDVPYWGVNGGVTKVATEAAWDALKADGSLSADFKFESIADMSFAEQAVKKLGPYSK
jgi:ABC-type nitrate/sulfonate/bicarbonate transport system substrate-binding protein